MSLAGGREWMYIDSTGGAQKGPVPVLVLSRLLEKGIGVSAQTLVWKAGMEAWLPMAEVEPFKSIVDFQTLQWYYLDSHNQQQGPIGSRLLIHKLKSGDVDGLTMVYGGTLTEWKQIADVPELKNEMLKISLEEQAAEAAAAAAQAASEAEQQQQVFIEEDAAAKFQLYEAYKAEQAKNAASTSSSSAEAKTNSETTTKKASEKKTFTSDSGATYGWDDAKQDWVEVQGRDGDEGEDAADMVFSDEEEQEEDEPEADESIGAGAGGGGSGSADSKKRKAEDGTDSTAAVDSDAAVATLPMKRRSKKKKAKKGPSTWVYITGLPRDVTAEEMNEHFSKVGLIALSPHDQQPYIKIYRDEADSGSCKGDASLCYNAEESVQTAVEFLDGGYIRPSHKITVSRADFTAMAASGQSSGGAAAGPKKPSLTHAQIKVAKSAIRQALTWNEDDDIGVSRAAALRIVVLEGMFSVEDFAADGTDGDTFAEELESDVASECERCGAIEKITVFSKNPRGVVIVKFATSYAAQDCIKLMNGRFFGGRRIKCVFWDGVTNYSIVQATEAEEAKEQARLDDFGDWLEKDQDELPEEFRLRTE